MRFTTLTINNSTGRTPKSLQELGQPLEALGVAHSFHDAHHKQLHWSHACALVGILLDLSAVSHVAIETQDIPQFILGGCCWDVDLVTQDHKRHIGKRLLVQQATQLLSGLLKSGSVSGIHDEDNTIHCCEIILPDATSGLVAAQVVSAEADVLNHELLSVRVQGRLQLRHPVVLQHVQQGSLASIVEAQEQDLRVLVVQTKVAEHVEKPIDDKHLDNAIGP